MAAWNDSGDNICLKIVTADAARLLHVLSQHVPQIENVTVSEDGLEVFLEISGGDLNLVAQICRKQGGELQILRRSGAFWRLKVLRKRPILVFGVAFLLLFLLRLPSRVLFVEVEGNVSVPERHILAAAEEIGVGFGSSRRQIHNESFKNAIVQMIPQLQWACVNTKGCVAVITVRERPVSVSETREIGIVRIIASCDGIVLSADATAGSLLCQPGQAVVKGQTLISGYTDCGLSIRATGANGEVYARTRHVFSLISPLSGAVRGEETGCRTRIGVIIGKNRINLWKDSGNYDTTCGRMYEEYYIMLPGGYRLPAAITVDRILSYETEEVSCVPNDDMAGFAREYLLSQLVSGRILQDQIQEEWLDGAVRLDGVFLCSEMIGREAAEEIGELHG